MNKKSKSDARAKITSQINPETSSIFARPRHVTDFQTDYRNVMHYFPLTSKKSFKESVEIFREFSQRNR